MMKLHKLIRCSGLVSAALMMTGFNAPPAMTLKGIDLARACQRQDDVGDQKLCRGFLDGFTYGSQLAVGADFIGQWRYGEQTWCFPTNVNHEQVRDAFVAYAGSHTGTLHFPAAIVLANAFAAAFPCR